MLVDSVTKSRIDRYRFKEGYLSPENSTSVFYSDSYLKNNNQGIKRPLKTSNHDLSFKGLSLYKSIDKIYNKKEFLKFSREYLGNMGEELLTDITEKHASRTKHLITVNGENITIHKKTIPHLALDGILYPFKILPADMLNG